jgi:hypothetical protein
VVRRCVLAWGRDGSFDDDGSWAEGIGHDWMVMVACRQVNSLVVWQVEPFNINLTLLTEEELETNRVFLRTFENSHNPNSSRGSYRRLIQHNASA